jgi:GNAT superfamily N-acetyltransferase
MKIRLLTPADAQPYQDLRLRMLREHPDAFTSSFDEDSRKPLSWTEDRLTAREDPAKFVVGAFDNGMLLGTAGISVEAREKQRHKALLFGMFTAPGHRGRGVGRAVLQASLERARQVRGLEQVLLTVTEGNAAERIYAASGFKRFGVEPRAIRVGAEYFGKVHMVLFLRP